MFMQLNICYNITSTQCKTLIFSETEAMAIINMNPYNFLWFIYYKGTALKIMCTNIEQRICYKKKCFTNTTNTNENIKNNFRLNLSNNQATIWEFLRDIHTYLQYSSWLEYAIPR